jgi:hypothetical protein
MSTPAWLAIMALGICPSGCADEVPPEDTSCSATQPLRLVGEVGEVDGNLVRNADNGGLTPKEECGAAPCAVGELTDRRITLDLGEVDFLVPGATVAESRSRRLVFQTNISDPEGSNLVENLNRRLNSGVEDADVLAVVAKDPAEYCDVEAGEICVRFGLDTTLDDELVKESDPVVHEGVSGTVTVKKLSAVSVSLEWDVEFGSNISKFGDTGSGQISGCFDSRRGNPNSGIEPLEVPGS